MVPSFSSLFHVLIFLFNDPVYEAIPHIKRHYSGPKYCFGPAYNDNKGVSVKVVCSFKVRQPNAADDLRYSRLSLTACILDFWKENYSSYVYKAITIVYHVI